MIKSLLVTSDQIGSSGATVTQNEHKALSRLGSVEVINPAPSKDPFETDAIATAQYKKLNTKFDLAHIYAGTYTQLVHCLKDDGCKVTYTAAAHDINESRDEHLILGMPYDYIHLTDPNLFERYVRGYKLADYVICPSKHSAQCMRSYGCENVEVVPHGCHIPSKINPISSRFTVGYLGACGPDKGIIYLISAWARLKYKDSQLVIGGRQSIQLIDMVRQFGNGSIFLAGYINDLDHFYNKISIYVQPSVTEGFGMEVVEAMSYGRPVVCSDGAGASDCVITKPHEQATGLIFNKRSIEQIADMIHYYKTNRSDLLMHGDNAKANATQFYDWDKILPAYLRIWRHVLGRPYINNTYLGG